MIGDMTANEVEVLNAFELLTQGNKKELREYMRYLLCRQYRREAMSAVFHNKLLQNMLHGLLHAVERDEVDREHLQRRVQQIRELYYALFEQVHLNYSQHIPDLDSNEVVTAFARNGFSSLESALNHGPVEMVRYEIINFCQEYDKLARRKDARNIVAV